MNHSKMQIAAIEQDTIVQFKADSLGTADLGSTSLLCYDPFLRKHEK
ncbi:hypothetical protein PAAL109150_03625 [Paenibacillus alkaliterrae]